MAYNGVKTYVFMDIESTGLPGVGEKPRIAEISFVAVQRRNLSERNRYIPRTLDKLLICCNPQKPMTSGAAWITGLYNDALEHLTPFDDTTVEMLNRFLKRLPQPVCLLAHNGNKFDFPMLKMELEHLGQSLADDVLCADTLEAFRSLDAQNADNCQAAENSTCTRNVTQVPNIDPQCLSRQSEIRLIDTDSPASKRMCTDRNSISHVITCSDEITPVKIGDVDSMQKNLIPPPAPKKRQFREDRTRSLGNTQTARRRLLQDDITEGMGFSGNSSASNSMSRPSVITEGSVSKNGLSFGFGVGIPSPPPSPQMPRRQKGSAKRRLKFGHSTSNENGSQDVEINTQTEIEVRDGEDLQKFPENFSDDSCDEKDDSVDMDEVQTLNYSQTGCGDAPDVQSQSLPDEDLIAAVDAMTAPVMAILENDADAQSVSDRTSANKVDEGGATAVVQQEKCNDKTNYFEVVALESTNVPDQTTSITPSPIPSTSGELYSGQTTPKRKSQMLDSSQVLNANNNDLSLTMIETDSNVNVELSTPAATPVRQQLKQSSRLSYKLEEIYKRAFGQSPRVSHTAEDDCISLIKIVQTCCNRFSLWVDQNAVIFSKIDKIY